MAKDKLKNVKISGIACCVPEDIIYMEEYNDILGKAEVDKFIKTTGIKQKHCNKSDVVITTGDLCYKAAEKLINELKIDRQSIDVLLLVTQSPDYIEPATACVLQYRLGLSNDCIAYDINLGCSGYVYGLHTAATYLQSGNIKKVLLLAGEVGANISPLDNMLFGEAGTATLLEFDNEQKNISFLFKTIGSGYKHLIYPYGGIRHGIGDDNKYVKTSHNGTKYFVGDMDGTEVFNFTINEVPSLVSEYNDFIGATNSNYDLFILHQANLFILNYLAKKIKISKTLMPISMDIYGNTSSASLALTICDYFNRTNLGDEVKKLNLLVCGFGIGLSLGITSFEISSDRCFPVICTKEGFEDGII